MDNNSEFKYPLRKCPIAIVGMACVFPKARDLQEYWSNIMKKEYCITDIPSTHWSIDDYYDQDPGAADKTYCKKGGFIPDIDFDPMEFGLPPNTLEATDISQLVSLVVAKKVLQDTGYDMDKLKRDRVGVILGSTTSKQLATTLKCRLQYPVLKKVLISSGISDSDSEAICKKFNLAYVDWQEGSFPGLLSNVISGRIANRFDLGGTNCTIDAACASSLAAIRMAISELVEHRCDLMLTGGVDTENDILTYMCFSKTPALSKKQVIRPFDIEADGTLISEGVGMIALKRLEDAERDKDRIYAVIKGMGSSSDGRSKSIYAPNSDGQKKALYRAYEEANFSASSVRLIEAHGTGTSAGDVAEFTALREYFDADSPEKQSIALGSVKSQIGHTKAAAGTASMIKAALSLYHKILPPTINVDQPNPKLDIDNTPFYLNSDVRPWVRTKNGPPRRAGVGACGFGGTNFHIILEEYENSANTNYRLHHVTETFFLFDENPDKLLGKCADTLKKFESETGKEYFNYLVENSKAEAIPSKSARIGFIVDSFDNAKELLRTACALPPEKYSADEWEDPKGMYYRKSGIDATQKVVALFSGQGSQYVNMGKEFLNNFPCAQDIFGHFDSLLTGDGLQPLSGIVYPIPAFGQDKSGDNNAMLQRTEYAQPAIGAFSLGLYKVLAASGFKPDFLAGHSFGEITALRASGILDDENYCLLVKSRGQAMAVPDVPGFDAGKMLAVKGELSIVHDVLKNFPEVAIANWNSNEQAVLAGPSKDIEQLHVLLKEKELYAVMLSVAAAFHTPLMDYSSKPFEEILDKISLNTAEMPVFSNTTAKMYPESTKSIRKQIKKHMLSPVLFKEEIENIYIAGGYVFVEFGPKNVLTNLTKNILKGKPHVTVALNPNSQKDSDRQLREAVMKLKVIGVSLGDIDLYRVKSTNEALQSKSSLTFRINGSTYVSEKTKKAFDEGLEDGFRINHSAQDPGIMPVADSPAEKIRGYFEAPGTSLSDAGAQSESMTAGLQGMPPIPRKEHVESKMRPVYDIGSYISEIKAQQNTSLEIHKMFLSNQFEYENNFFQAISQISLCQENSINSSLLHTLDSSLSTYHDFQTGILKAHEDYLKNITRQDDRLLSIMETLVTMNPIHPVDTQTVQISGGADMKEPVPAINGFPIPVVPKMEEKAPSLGSYALAGGQDIHSPDVNASKPDTTPQKGSEWITSTLLSIVSEKTGYPVETLDLDMDMEADLGIDSIKRVEILGAMRAALPDLPKANTEAMSEVRTLKAIVDYLDKKMSVTTCQPYENRGMGNSAQQAPAVQADAERITSALLSIVSEKTGYPVETLELDMDMEADLGIDSIKRVEILGAMRAAFPGFSKEKTEAMSGLRTLKAITDYLNSVIASESSNSENGESDRGEASDELKKNRFSIDEKEIFEKHNIGRYIVKPKYLPAPDHIDRMLPSDHVVIITNNGTETAGKLYQGLTDCGWKVVVINFPDFLTGKSQQLNFTADSVELKELNEVGLKQTLGEISEKFGPIAGFIHLNPLFYNTSGSERLYPDEEKIMAKQIFFFAKHLQQSLKEAALKGFSFFITVTGLDGKLGLDGCYGAASGALYGLIKTLDQEWQSVFCRAIDFDQRLSAQQWADCIIAEIHDPGQRITEVGYHNGKRCTIICEEPVTGPAEKEYKNDVEITRNSVFVVSGGARGITAQCVIELARRHQCKFLLLGRSPLVDEPDWAKGHRDESGLKKKVMEFLIGNNQKPTPALIQEKYNSIISAREINETLQAIRAAGSEAEYCSTDVRVKNQLSETLQSAGKRFGKITGIIHGAGVLADKLIEKKSEQDFNNVFSVKVQGLENLLDCIPCEQLEHIILFSSTAGFYGNAGQADYAMANEVLNKSAYLLKRKFPSCYVRAINWGPWDSGMVSPELKKAFMERDIKLIPANIGALAFVNELTSHQAPVQAVIGSALTKAVKKNSSSSLKYRIKRKISLEDNPFLQDHAIGDNCVLPAACAMSWLADNCLTIDPGYQFSSCESFKVLKGVVFDELLNNEFVTDISEISRVANDEVKYEVKIWSPSKSNRIYYNYSGIVTLKNSGASQEIRQEWDCAQNNREIEGGALYRNGILFHGPSFQGLERVIYMDSKKLVMDCVLNEVPPQTQGQFSVLSFNSYIVDTLLQGIAVWTGHLLDSGCVPLEIERFEQFHPMGFGSPYTVHVEVRDVNDSDTIADIVAHDGNGLVYYRIKGVRATYSKRLNPLFKKVKENI